MTRHRQQRRSFLARVKELLFGSVESERPQTRRRLRFDQLEGRQLMAVDVAVGDLGTISGHVFRDTSGDSAWQVGETGISQVSVQLWKDNGDGLFNAADTKASTQLTSADGLYTFTNLGIGDYYLYRPAQILSSGTNPGITLNARYSGMLHVSALKTVVDSFDAPASQTAAADTTNDNTPATSIASGISATTTLGGEREILTNFTGDAEGPGILASARVATINVNGAPAGLLLLDATSSAKATYTVVYDGSDGVASLTPNLSPGLGGINLTAGGATHLRINLNSFDLPGANVRVTVYTDATHYSTGTLTLQNGIVDYHFNFDGSGTGGFAVGAGAAGAASFSSVRAVVMSIDIPSDFDGRLEMLGAYGLANYTSDLAANQVDVSVNKTVSNAAPIVGTNINYTLSVSNAQTLANGQPSGYASGVILNDTTFLSLVTSGKLSYVSDNSNGAFNPATGVWTVGNLATGQTKSVVLTMKVNQAAMPTIDNTLSLTSLNQIDVDTDDWTKTVKVTPKNVDIAVTKTVNNNHPNHSDPVVFTVTAKNLGTAGATGVALTDAFSSLVGYHVDSVTASAGSYSQATGVWTIGNLAPNQAVTLTVSGGLVAGQCDAFTNTASVATIGGGAIDTNTTNNSASVTVKPQEADLGVTKTVTANSNPNQASPNVTFQIVVSNAGPDAATGVVIADQIPAGMTFVSSSSTGYNAATGVWTIGTIASGSSATLTVQAKLNSGVTTATISNTASVAALDQCDDNAANNSSTVSIAPQSVDLSVTKTVNNATPNYHQNVIFTVTVTNAGPSAATNVKLLDTLPAGLTFVVANSSQGSYDSATGIWTVGTIGVGQSKSLSLTAQVNSTTMQTNTAEVMAADQTDIDSTPNNHVASEDDMASASVTPQLMDLSVTKTVNNSAPNLHGQVTFTITVTNSGPNAATGVTLYDAMSGGLGYISSSATKGSLNAATHIWTIGSIGVGETDTLTITAVANSPDLQMNTVEVLAADQTDIDSTPANGQAGEDDIASVVVQPQVVDLSVTKMVDTPVAAFGASVNFTISVTNSGPGNATGVSLFDAMSPGLTYVGSIATRGSFNPATHIWTVGSLGVGESALLTLTATAGISGPMMNTAEVFTADQPDIDSTPNNGMAGEDDIASAAVFVQPAIKNADPDPLTKRRFLAR